MSAVQEPCQVWPASALRDQPSSRRQRAMDAREQLVVVANPMERGGAEHRIEPVHEWQMRGVASDQMNGDTVIIHAAGTSRRTPLRETRPRFSQHRPRHVEADHHAVTHRAGKPFREPSAAASQVEDSFPRPWTQLVEHPNAPRKLRVGESVVGFSVPVHH